MPAQPLRRTGGGRSLVPRRGPRLPLGGPMLPLLLRAPQGHAIQAQA
jgi:hypothetical protein